MTIKICTKKFNVGCYTSLNFQQFVAYTRTIKNLIQNKHRKGSNPYSASIFDWVTGRVKNFPNGPSVNSLVDPA